jgi:hypothetical protein
MTVTRSYRSWAGGHSRARARRGLLAALGAAALGLTIGPAAAALGDPPLVSIESPANGAVINSSTPLFNGSTQEPLGWSDELEEEVLDPISVLITPKGAGTSTNVIATTSESGAWSAIAPPLADESYTAHAIQTRLGRGPHVEAIESVPVEFTIDTAPPQVAIATPANGSSSTSAPPFLGGPAGTTAGDLPSITVRIFTGATIGSQPALETLVAQASGGGWSAALGGLPPGTYTAQAEQRDQAGNAGVSQPVTFVVVGPLAPPAPTASFKWFPPVPRAGEPVSLVSSSTDSFSAITGFAWSLSSGGPFSVGKPVLTTSFATPGAHVVRLQVTDAGGRSSIATQTIPVGPRAMTLMQPFPIVRIAGSLISGGARISLLTVQAPPGAVVQVACVGRRCRTKSESRVARASKSKRPSGAVLLAFSHFEVPLRAGVTLQIRVTKSGRIGKFTSLTIRRGKLPVRADACLSPASSKPSPCPSS